MFGFFFFLSGKFQEDNDTISDNGDRLFPETIVLMFLYIPFSSFGPVFWIKLI